MADNRLNYSLNRSALSVIKSSALRWRPSVFGEILQWSQFSVAGNQHFSELLTVEQRRVVQRIFIPGTPTACRLLKILCFLDGLKIWSIFRKAVCVEWMVLALVTCASVWTRTQGAQEIFWNINYIRNLMRMIHYSVCLSQKIMRNPKTTCGNRRTMLMGKSREPSPPPTPLPLWRLAVCTVSIVPADAWFQASTAV